ncbi:MAG: hypothetical protein MUC87_04895 [Bacteroidia bacterium]|jgi:hypothetical protein|nr:hypothetical protein [Bacteroidia bacterium]
MKKLAVFLLLLLPLLAADTQKTAVIAEKSEQMLTDNLGNVYLVLADRIRKFDQRGQFQKEFSNKNFGSITTADATNPLRILLFYRDFSRIIFLDNTLSQNGEPVQLEALGYPLTTLAATSYDNGLWIYDQQNFELLRLNRNLQIEQRTGNLSQQLGIELHPNFILEKDNRLFMNNPETGVLVFDVFGTYSKQLPLPGLSQFQIDDDALVWFDGKQLHSYALSTYENSVYEKPVDSLARSMRIEKPVVVVQRSDSVLIYPRR